MASGNKQYGLILPQKGGVTKASAIPRANVFGNDSDSETEDGGDWVKNTFKHNADKSTKKHSVKTQVRKALEEDPTVFQYDEIYDDLEQSKADKKSAQKGTEKKPRYIQALLQTAERRKRENERRVERQVQKEREEEGTQFSDKESFVTASYRAKLEEFKKQEEEEKRMERLEAIADVTKQKDLTGFYRHLYRQTMGESLVNDNAEQNPITVGDAETTCGEEPSNETAVVKKEIKKDRQYRKRQSSSPSSSDGETTNAKIKKNVDADSDLSSSSSSSTSDSESSGMESGSEEGEITKKKKKNENASEDVSQPLPKKLKQEDGVKIELEKEKAVDAEPNQMKRSEESNKQSPTKESDETSQDAHDLTQKENKIPKICIWTKRTVGQIYEDAVRRYFERKADRTAGRA